VLRESVLFSAFATGVLLRGKLREPPILFGELAIGASETTLTLLTVEVRVVALHMRRILGESPILGVLAIGA
jgi:hypothetical protein